MYIINQFLREIDVKNNEQLGTKLIDDFIRNEATVTLRFTEHEQITSDTIKTIVDSKDNTEELEEYEKRGEHVTAACKEYQSEISARYKDVWPKESYLTVLDKADVFINRNAGFLWCRVPKAASESITSVFINQW